MDNYNNQTNASEENDTTYQILQQHHQVSIESIIQLQHNCRDLTERLQTYDRRMVPQHTPIYKDLQQPPQIQQYTNNRVEQPPHQPATKPHVCNICNKSFKSKYRLGAHHRLHTGKNLHMCDICHKGFTTKYDLDRHYLIHTGEKSHVCKVCNKRFNSKSHLVEHYMTHTGLKPHVCKVCKIGFVNSTRLKSHSLIHTCQKPKVCDICQRMFIWAGTLKRHYLTHSTEKKRKGQTITEREEQDQIKMNIADFETVSQDILEAGDDQQQQEVEINLPAIQTQTKPAKSKINLGESSGSHEHASTPTEQQQVHFENAQPLPSIYRAFPQTFNRTSNIVSQNFYPLNEIYQQDTAHIGYQVRHQIVQRIPEQISHETFASIDQQPFTAVDLERDVKNP